MFADPKKVRRIAHAGRHFTVDGPLNSPRSPQGRPVLIQAAGPGRGKGRGAGRAAGWPERGAGAGAGGGKVIVDLAFSLTGAAIPPAAPALVHVGEAEDLAELMAAWMAAGACDGFNLLPARLAEDATAFAEHAAPLLRARA